MDNTAIYVEQQCIINGSQLHMKQSNDIYSMQVTMQSCLDAGAPPDLLRQIIAMYRRHYAGNKEMQFVINDVEVRYITSLEGYTP
ncbi:hypothetical protein NSS64_32400 [Paenibacillus sp. FSL H8-0122]|uniref:hypothetical protein n=1 Tax=Paenibacillus sp. FSL H8-0122 TaxID=2954510 RepID=UPI0030F4F503